MYKGVYVNITQDCAFDIFTSIFIAYMYILDCIIKTDIYDELIQIELDKTNIFFPCECDDFYGFILTYID